MVASALGNNTLFKDELNSGVIISLSEASLNTLKFTVNILGNGASDFGEPLLFCSEVESFSCDFSKNINLLHEVLSEKLLSSLVFFSDGFGNAFFIFNLLETDESLDCQHLLDIFKVLTELSQVSISLGNGNIEMSINNLL